MYLPVLNPLNTDESTYITFSKALLDLDKANAFNTPYYFTYMIAMNLPNWQDPDFFIDLSEVGETSSNPNVVFPKLIQYYMENIIRQDISTPEITELAFYKSLNKCGLEFSDIRDRIVFCNKIVTENFIESEANNGWSEILGLIPNKCDLLGKVFRETSIPSIVQSTDEDGLFDNGDRQFLFPEDSRFVIDFNNLSYDKITKQSFDFNVILVFYKDSEGVDKLHGINFIYPFNNKITYFELPRLTQKTNEARGIGYQFLFNMKSCNNEASKTLVYEWNGQAFYNSFERTMSLLASFLENEMNKTKENII